MDERSTVVVTADLEGVRADRVLAVLAGLSRAAAQRLIVDGEVLRGGAVVDRSTRLRAGDVLGYPTPVAEGDLVPEPVDFEVVFDEGDVLVIDKPSGLVVHPGAGHRRGTLVHGLVHRFPELGALGEEHRWGLVHRLDRDTSGVLLVARTAATHVFLQSELKQRRIGRSYLALVHGQPEAATGTIDAPIGRDRARPTRMAVVGDGRPARTHFRRLAAWADTSLLRLELETGRTHQIRVHLASIGHAVVGDRTYGRSGRVPGDPGRVWLHASEIRFPTIDGGTRTAGADLAKDLRRSLAELGEPGDGTVDL
jgi:23S rRNA pseudouridine1911/1915/1917 synthase